MPWAQPLTVWAAESSSTVWCAPGAKLGASFTGATVIVTVAGALTSMPP